MNIRNTLAAGALVMMAATAPAAQVAYPQDKPVSIVVGFSAGGSSDMLGRLLAKELAAELNARFIVENRPGANSNIAMGHVARSEPDGHTLLLVPFGLPVNPYLYQQVPYDAARDFAPIALVARVPNAIVVNADSPIRTVQDYVAASKASPQALSYGTPGVGSSLHLAGELFRYETGANLLHVPYKGSAPSLMAVMGKETDSAFDNLSTVASQLAGGKLRVLAVTSKTRSPSFPDFPTVAESGFPNYEINSYFGLAAPAGTPKEIVNRLNRAVMNALTRPEMQAYLNGLGAIVEDNSPEDFSAFLRAEGERWGPVIKSANIQPGS